MPDPIPSTSDTLTPPAVEWVGSTTVLPDIPPPLDDMSWVDIPATYEAVLLTLRITTSDPDAAQVLSCIDAAAAEINQYLDRWVALPLPPPAPVQQALEQRTVELYRRKDAPFALLNSTAPEDVPTNIGTGSTMSIAPLIQPWKQRWGFA